MDCNLIVGFSNLLTPLDRGHACTHRVIMSSCYKVHCGTEDLVMENLFCGGGGGGGGGGVIDANSLASFRMQILRLQFARGVSV